MDWDNTVYAFSTDVGPGNLGPSPPYFYAVTETATDVTNHQCMNTQYAPPHHLGRVAAAADEITPPPPSQSPVDFGATVRGPPSAPITSSPLLHPVAYTPILLCQRFCTLVQGNHRQMHGTPYYHARH